MQPYGVLLIKAHVMKLPRFTLSSYRSALYKKQSEISLEEEDNKYKIALEISNVGVWDWDIKTSKVFYSEVSKNIIGFDSNELISSKAWNDRIHPEDRESYYSDLNMHLQGEKDIYDHKYRVLSKDGSYKWILAKGKFIEKDAKGKPLRAIGTLSDITTFEKNKNQLKNNLQVITSENKRLQNFTHIVSHNLKTHIGNLKNILEFYDEADNETEKEELIGHLNSISESLTTTIVDLDDIISIKSKSNGNQLNEHVGLYNCVNKISESLRMDSEKNGVTIHNALRQDETLFTNQSYLESVFYNLISNGIKYADPNKKSHIIIQSIHTKDTIKILISDNGIGIDTSKYKNQLFNMYQTFHGTERKDSRGIGLYITKTQVESLNGKIEVESTLHEGTAFSLTFKKQKALLKNTL